MLVLTNCTFDGHVYNVERVMEECLAIKPDLIFLWDEAWFGFARFSPFLPPPHRDGRRRELEARFKDPATAPRTQAQAAELGDDLDPDGRALLDMRLLPDPDKVRIRVYQTNSTHKSMSALRQGSMVAGQGRGLTTAWRSSSRRRSSRTPPPRPNLQIIASLDVARRQMELEGYELVNARDPARARYPPRDQHASADLQVLPRAGRRTT